METDVAFVSIWHKRAVRELTFSVEVLTFCSSAVNNAILATRAFNGLFNTGNSGGDNFHGFTEGLDVVVKICESTRVVTKDLGAF